MTGQPRFTVSLPAQTDPLIGREIIEVRYEDGRVEELHLHDYERLYALPGAYEQIVSDRLGCVSPQVIASRCTMLALASMLFACQIFHVSLSAFVSTTAA